MGKSPNAATSRPGTANESSRSPSLKKQKGIANTKISKRSAGSMVSDKMPADDGEKLQPTDSVLSGEKLFNDQSLLLALAENLLDTPNFNPAIFFEKVKEFIPFEDAALYRYSDGSLNPIGFFRKENRGRSPGAALILESPELFESFWHRLPVVWSNLAGDAQVLPHPIQELRQWGLTDVFTSMDSQIWAPLFSHNRLFGCLGFGCAAPNTFSEYHSILAQKTAGIAASALANCENLAQVQKSAALEERKNLARSLHDAINQSLFSAGLIAEVLPHVWNKDQADGARSLEDLRRLIRGAQAEIRIILVELRHSPTIDVEIADLLHLLANAFTGRTNIPVDEDIQKDNSLPPKVRTAYYHLCQEALNNIVKHAKATRVQLSFGKNGDRYILSIKDNGIGFDRRRKGIRRDKKEFRPELREKGGGFNPKYIPPGHYGLRMMNEMANSVGAEMKIETRPGFGTSISIYWNCAPQKEEEQE